eukprot:SAG31_NODE_3433_length_4277_cov_11.720747_2_plen_154_part_00
MEPFPLLKEREGILYTFRKLCIALFAVVQFTAIIHDHTHVDSTGHSTSAMFSVTATLYKTATKQNAAHTIRDHQYHHVCRLDKQRTASKRTRNSFLALERCEIQGVNSLQFVQLVKKLFGLRCQTLDEVCRIRVWVGSLQTRMRKSAGNAAPE